MMARTPSLMIATFPIAIAYRKEGSHRDRARPSPKRGSKKSTTRAVTRLPNKQGLCVRGGSRDGGANSRLNGEVGTRTAPSRPRAPTRSDLQLWANHTTEARSISSTMRFNSSSGMFGKREVCSGGRNVRRMLSTTWVSPSAIKCCKMALYRGRLNEKADNINRAGISLTWMAMGIAPTHLFQICHRDVYKSILSGTGRMDVGRGASENGDRRRVVALVEFAHPQKRDQCLSAGGSAGQ